MTRTKDLNGIRIYFHYDAETDKSHCNIPTNAGAICTSVLSGNKSSNLITHVRSIHPNVYEDFIKDYKKKRASEGFSNLPRFSTYKMPKLSLDSDSTVTVTVPKEKVFRGVIEYLIVNDRPLSSLKDDGLQLLCGDLLKATGLYLNTKSIKELVQLMYDDAVREMKNQIKSKLVSVKVDVISKSQQTYLGINIQFIKDQSVQLFTIAVPVFVAVPTSSHLKEILIEELIKFNIYHTYQIYTICFTNAWNTLTEREFDKFDNTDVQIVDTIMNDIQWENECILNMKCASHTLLLAVTDLLNNDDKLLKNYNNLIAAARDLMTTFKSKKIQALIKVRNLKIPSGSVDSSTRWCSTYSMLESILENRSLYDELSDEISLMYDFSNEELWSGVKEIVESLRPSYRLLSKLQNPNLTFTDVYKSACVCLFSTSEISSLFASELVKCLNKRKDQVFENEVAYAAMYLDPRLQWELTEDKRIKAISHLTRIYGKLQDLHIIHCEEQDSSSSVLNAETIVDYEKVLKVSDLPNPFAAQDITSILKEYEPLREKITSDILQYWDGQKLNHPELHLLAMTVLAVPNNQVSIDNLDTSISFIRNQYKTSYFKDVIDQVMFLKLNYFRLGNKKSTIEE